MQAFVNGQSTLIAGGPEVADVRKLVGDVDGRKTRG